MHPTAMDVYYELCRLFCCCCPGNEETDRQKDIEHVLGSRAGQRTEPVKSASSPSVKPR